MADVSIPINHARVHPLNSTENSKRGPKKIISLIVMLTIFLNIAALILILSGLIKLDATKKAFWAEIISQFLNGFFVLILLATSHTRIIPLVAIIQLLFLKSNDIDTTCYIDNQKLLKKYVIWYDERYDSLSYLLLIHVLWMFNIFSQAFIAFLTWTFSSYDQNGNIVFPMITLNPRPMDFMTFCIIIAITSAIIAGILTGYKSYKKKQLQKLEKFITVT